MAQHLDIKGDVKVVYDFYANRDLETQFRECLRSDRLAWVLYDRLDEFATIAGVSGYTCESRFFHAGTDGSLFLVLVHVIPQRVY